MIFFDPTAVPIWSYTMQKNIKKSIDLEIYKFANDSSEIDENDVLRVFNVYYRSS